uniref:Uncharacterized protein n=1 Tax=Moniliophthora roreri TaxID=221103 RepID=A0A0W0F0A6_MONRR
MPSSDSVTNDLLICLR